MKALWLAVAVGACGQVAPQAGPVGVAGPGQALAGTQGPGEGPAAGSGLAAFPGAEGFGARATGGRGGWVIAVTTLATSGPGSLQAAVDEAGPRTVVFRVGGVIDGPVHITHGDLTISGQTAPGGITVRGLHTTEEPYCDQACGADIRGVENFIIRHVRSRPAGNDFSDGLRLRYARNGIIDHMSIGNAADEAVELSYARDLTIQYTLLAETLGEHASLGGMLINYSDPAAGFELGNLSIHHNVWNRVDGRMPEFSRESPAAAGTTMQVELANNLLWDPGFYIDMNPTTISGSMDGRPIYYAINWVGNLAVARPEFPYGVIWLPNPEGKSSAYFADNRLNLAPTRRDFGLMHCCNDFKQSEPAAAPAWARGERHPFPAIAYTPVDRLQALLGAQAGAFPRDAMDERLMAAVQRGVIEAAPRSVNPAGDALRPLPAAAAPVDGDGDGMADEWERAQGLDPAVADGNGLGLSQRLTGVAGYTNLECYLNALADLRAGRTR